MAEVARGSCGAVRKAHSSGGERPCDVDQSCSLWTDFGTWPWREARYGGYRNRGPGAAVTPDRPQLTAAEAAGRTSAAYLNGGDGWNPVR
ncbi:hypothetical protein [Dactylosporangium salmoneum]|uniref:Uncharacterized protein n=1 Tax=Dactylosporangium salmoneum TaxID=53361 RepID=A0ABN3HT83_9ACTN